MVRFAVLLVLLAGCDQVFGLERSGIDPRLDEDADGVPDAIDPCPHIANESLVDDDQDGVPVDCDPDDHAGGTQRLFFNFEGPMPAQLIVNGTIDIDPDGSVELGSANSSIDSIVVDHLTTSTVLVDVGYEILANKIEDVPMAYGPFDYAELGLYTAKRSLDDDKTMRGNVCFFGTNPMSASVPQPLYVEFAEDAGGFLAKREIGTLDGTTGRMRLVRTPLEVKCTVLRDGQGLLSNVAPVQDLGAAAGTVAVSTDAMRGKLRYLFIAYQ